MQIQHIFSIADLFWVFQIPTIARYKAILPVNALQCVTKCVQAGFFHKISIIHGFDLIGELKQLLALSGAKFNRCSPLSELIGYFFLITDPQTGDFHHLAHARVLK